MAEPDPNRIVAAARDFIAVLTRHGRQYDAPGNDTSHGALGVIDAGRELHLALEGRTLFDPPPPPADPDPDVRIFVGAGSMEIDRQCGIIRECMRRLLRRTGFRGSLRTEGMPYVDASHGTLPSMEGLEDLPQVGLSELEPLIDATDGLEELARRFGPSPALPAPPDPLEVTVEILAGCRRAIEIVRYLAGCKGRRATLREIAVDVYKRKMPTAATRNIRRQIERDAKRLDVEGSPLLLTIDDSTACLVSRD